MIFDPNYKEVDIKGYEGLYKISNKIVIFLIKLIKDGLLVLQ